MNLAPEPGRSAPFDRNRQEDSQAAYCISFSALFVPSPFQKSSKVPSSRVCSLTLHAHLAAAFPFLALGEYVDVLINFLYDLLCFQLAEAARISLAKVRISSSEGISDGLIGSPMERTLDCSWDMTAAEERPGKS